MNKKRKIIALLIAVVVILSVGGYVFYADPGDATCGKEEHTHTAACYEEQFTCIWDKLQDNDPVTPGGNIVLNCTTPAHAHTDACYDISVTRICTVPEHVHTETCESVTVAPVCGMPEHMHSDACNTVQSTLICNQDHEHVETCYNTTWSFTCGLAEHYHSDACNGQIVSYICGMTEHTHNAACDQETRTLICTQTEHTHVKSCCSHTHGDSCKGKVLICTLEQHTHTDACYPDGKPAEVRDVTGKPDNEDRIDLSADLETPEDWEKTIPQRLYGSWADKVVKVARSQLGEQESRYNRVECTDTLGQTYMGGYTRYGAWFGDPYGHWCAMFASFCIRYAGIDDFPINSNVQSWMTALQERGCYNSIESGYVPKAGDLIFFKRDSIPGHVGIVTSYRVAPLKDLIDSGTGRAQALVNIFNGDAFSTYVEKEITDEDMAIEITTIEGNVRNKGSKVDSVLERRYVVTEDDTCTILGFASVSTAEETNAASKLIHNLSQSVVEVYNGRYSDSYKLSLYADPQLFKSDNITLKFVPAQNSECYLIDITVDGEHVNPNGDIYMMFTGYNGELRDPNMDYVTLITANDRLFSYYFADSTKPDAFKIIRDEEGA